MVPTGLLSYPNGVLRSHITTCPFSISQCDMSMSQFNFMSISNTPFLKSTLSFNIIDSLCHPTPPRSPPTPPTPRPPMMKSSTPQNYHQTNPMYRKPQKNRLHRNPPTPPEPQPPMKKPPKQISTQHDQRKHHQVAKLSAIPYPGGTVCARLRHQL